MDKPKVRMGYEHRQVADQQRLGELLWDIHTATGRLVELTAGRSEEEFAESDLLQAVAGTLLPLIADGLRSLAAGYPDELERLPAAARLMETAADTPAMWLAVSRSVPALAGEVRERLEAWHEG